MVTTPTAGARTCDPRRRRSRAAGAALALCTLLVVGTTAPATAVPDGDGLRSQPQKTQVTLTLTFDASTASVGTKVPMSIRAVPAPRTPPRPKVLVQYRDGGGWRTLGALRLFANGAVRSWVSKESPAVRRYRAVLVETADYARSVSDVRRIVWTR